MEIRLKKNEHLTFARTSQKMKVSCVTGTVWLTQQSDQNDHILLAGANFTANYKKIIVVFALNASTVTVSTAAKRNDADFEDKDFLFKIEETTPQRRWGWRRVNG